MEDYLWDKTGEDEEIRALENALTAFRLQENAPPALPQKVFTVERRNWRRFFRFGLAFASLASVVVVFALGWFNFSGDLVPANGIAAQTGALKAAEPIADAPFTEPPGAAIVEPAENAPPAAKPGIVKISRRREPLRRTPKVVRRQSPTAAPVETLTAEERYAYNQLMLALSITGTQLKIVKDKVQGIEEQSASLETTK